MTLAKRNGEKVTPTAATVGASENGESFHKRNVTQARKKDTNVLALETLADSGGHFAIAPSGQKGPVEKNWPNKRYGLDKALKAYNDGDNIGLNMKQSDGLVALDFDGQGNYRAFCNQYPDLADSLTIYRDNAKERAKVVFQLEGDCSLDGKKADTDNAIELFVGTGQIIVTGEHPSEALYKVKNANNIRGVTEDKLRAIWENFSNKDLSADSGEPQPGISRGVEAFGVQNHPYAQAALDEEVRKVATAKNGSRNNTLFKAACSLHELVNGECLDANVVDNKLTRAAMDAGLDVAEIATTLESAKKSVADRKRGIPKSQTKPKVIVNRRFDYVDDAISALAETNDPPTIFEKNRRLVKVTPDDNGIPGALPMGTYQLKGEFGKRVDFSRLKKDSDGNLEEKPTPPPIDMVRAVKEQSHYPQIPTLEGVVTAPVFAPDGTLENKPGYLPKTKLYFYPQKGLSVGDTSPTGARVEWAKDLILNHLLVDFPFEGQSDLANTVALMLLPFVRPMIDGPTPLHQIEAPQAGSGKTLLATATAYPFLGNKLHMYTAGSNDDEWRKRITTALRPGPSHVCFDNVNEILDSGSLAAALTTNFWTDRLLGGNEEVSIPVRNVWIATGNNITTSIEIGRRICRIRLVPRVEHPSLRDSSEFKHSPLLPWVDKNRSELVTASLTLIRAWIEEGQPKDRSHTIGSYEDWATKMGGILKIAGIDGFMGNFEDYLTKGNPKKKAWTAFFNEWYEQFEGNPVGVKELFPIASYETGSGIHKGTEGQNLLGVILGDGSEASRRVKLGQKLGDKKDTVFGDFMLAEVGSGRSGATRYRLIKL